MTPLDALHRLVAGAVPPPVTSAMRRSAVLVLFGPGPAGASRPDDLEVLLQRRSSDLEHHPGQVSFPGGGIDPGETETQAALREAVEETGLDPTGVDVVGLLPPVPITVSRNVVTPVVAWWASPSDVGPVDTSETEAVFRVRVRDLLDPQRRVMVGTRVPTPGFVVDPVGGDGAREVVVWGFTAMVLSDVLDRTGWALAWDRRRTIGVPDL